MSVLKSACRLVVLAIATLAVAASSQADDTRWYSSLEDASARARDTGQPMLVDFWADWCVACKVMEKEVYSDRGVADAARSFLAVRIDYDKHTDIAKKYNVTALPTIVFTDSYGNEIFRYAGFIDVQRFNALLRALPHDMTAINELSRILARDRNNFAALDAMGRRLRDAGLFRASNDYYGRALQRTEARADPDKRAAILAEIGANYLEVKEGKKAAEIFEKCLKEFPASARRDEWSSRLAQARALAAR
jgi:thioredoxin-like negative regulator of GroEL